jgi:transposase
MRSLDAAPYNAREENAFSERHGASAPFPIRWQSTPEIVRQVRDIRRRGLPIVHLWQSTRALVAIGLNKHGVPGIYITQRVPD